MSYQIKADVGFAGGGLHNWRDVFAEGSSTARAYNMRLSKEINSAGSLSFTITPTHPLYDSIDILSTTVYANANGASFLGRVMSIQTDMSKNKIVDCEGALSWLSDIIARPHLWYDAYGEERDAYPLEYIEWLSSQHNSRASAKRHVSIFADYPNLWDAQNSGGTYISKPIIKGNEDYKTCLQALTDLTNLDENAVIIPNYNATDVTSQLMVCVLNIVNIKAYGGTWGGMINFQGNDANLIHVDVDITGDDVFTSIVPLGKDKMTLNAGSSIDYVDGTMYNRYGVIEKVSDYETVENAGDLGDRAYAELAKITSKVNALTIQAVGLTADLGSNVTVVDTAHGISGSYIVTALSIDIDSLGQSTYTLFPSGSSYAGKMSTTLVDVAKNGGQKYQNSTTFSSGESPSQVIQEDDTHIKAVGQKWTTHFVATESETTEGEYTLDIYRTESSS